MRIIVWGINYVPELTGIAPFNTGLCDFLKGRGHQVEMVTSFPYYPFWRKLPGDKGRLFRTDELDGVWVHRCWHYVPQKVTTLRRILHELSFGLTSFLRLLFLSRPDVYLVVSPPLLLGPLASLLGWVKRTPYVFHVQDLQPDAAVGLGMVKPGTLTRLLYRIEAWSYRHAATVSGISREMLEAFEQKGVRESRRMLFPNWIRWYGRNTGVIESDKRREERVVAFRTKFNLPRDAFIAAYSGNLGKKQGLDTLLEAAEKLFVQASEGDSVAARINLLVVGDGAMRTTIEERIRSRGLKNVRLMPLLVENDYHGLLAAADVSLILQASGTGRYFLPSKLLSILSAGGPVVTAADADSPLARAVEEGAFGVNVPPADPIRLAEALRGLATSPDRLRPMRQRTNWVEQFAGETVLPRFERRLLALVK